MVTTTRTAYSATGLSAGSHSFYVKPIVSGSEGAASNIQTILVPGAALPSPTPTSFTRPSGPGYVTYESLYVAGDTLTRTLARCPAGQIVTFGVGAYEATEFSSSDNSGIFVPTTCGGIWGSGPGTLAHSADANPTDGTYFRMKANSSSYSTVSASAATPTTMESLGATVDQSFGQFAVVGSPQSSNLTRFQNFGLRNSPQTNKVSLTDIASYGHLGYANYPPGETFGINVDGWTHHTMTRVEGDGRRADGIRYGSSPLTAQHTSSGVWTDCYGHHSIAGMPTFYEVSGITTYNLRSEYNGTGSGMLNGACVNHERTTGIVHNNLSIILSPSPNSGQHISHANDDWSVYGNGESRCLPWTNGTLTINGITFNTGFNNPGVLYVLDGSEQGNPSSDTTPPAIFDSAGNPIHFRWQSSISGVVYT